VSPRLMTALTGLIALLWIAVVLGDCALVSPAWSSPGVAAVHFLLLMVGTLVALVCAIIALTATLGRSPRSWAARSSAIALLLASVGLPVVAETAANRIRLAGFARCTERLTPVIHAIREYEARVGTPPARLAELVPGYLPALPSTGLRAYPEVEYSVTPQPHERYGNSWMIAIPAFRGDWDQVVFLPNGQYPELAFGGSLERVGDWAYVHE